MAAATMYVTPAGAGVKNGSSWANAFGLAEWETDAEGSAEQGDIYRLLEKNTYTLTQNFDASGRDGGTTNVIRVIGVNEAGVPATGDDRPLIDVGTYQFRLGKYWILDNIRATGTANFGHTFYVQAGGSFHNCKGYAGGNDGTVFHFTGIEGKAVGCEAEAPIGFGFNAGGNTVLFGCYMHDSEKGIRVQGSRVRVLNCIFDTLPLQGMDCQSYDNLIIIGNTFYNCTYGVLSTSSDSCLVMNNIIANCLLGLAWNPEQQSNFFDHNNYYNNSSDVNNVTKGPNAMALDPEFVDAANGDFRIGQNLAGRGFPREFPGGLSRSYLDVGAIQRIGLAIVSGWFTLIGTQR